MIVIKCTKKEKETIKTAFLNSDFCLSVNNCCERMSCSECLENNIFWMEEELDKEDIICMVKSQSVPYSTIPIYEEKGLGKYSSGFLDEWNWNVAALERLSEKELFEMYQTLKKQWRQLKL